MNLKTILILVAGAGFCVSSVAYLCVKFALRPKSSQAWEQDHWGFEDHHPAIKRYHFWSRILFAAVIISMLLLFISISV